MVFGEFAREDERQDWVGCEDEQDREQITADDNGDGFEHRLCLLGGEKARASVDCVQNRFGQIYTSANYIARAIALAGSFS